MFDAMPGIFDGGHLSSGGLSVADFFRSIYLPAGDGHFADDTNQYRLVDGSEHSGPFEMSGLSSSLSADILGINFPIKLHSPAVQQWLNNPDLCPLCGFRGRLVPQYIGRCRWPGTSP